ncbi:MAG: DHA2 family efflux MFS transporter permease subunit [Nakamurella sp.]
MRLASASGRWLIVVAVLGSGIAFLDGTVVNVALPSIGEHLETGLSGQQWVLDGYLLTLGALLLAGGAAGDRYGRRRIFLYGLVAFTVASVACGVAPNAGVLIGARMVQGIGAAALIPGSLALITSSIDPRDRARAIGIWAGMSGVTSALGPFLGGYLVDAASWRWVFLINVPLAAIALPLALKHVPESKDDSARARGPFDILGAVLVTVGLAGLVYGLIEGSSLAWNAATIGAVAVGAAVLAAFLWRETKAPAPLLPLKLFASKQFSGANAATFVVYAALSVSMFLLTLQLQQSLGYSALAAGAATVPTTIIMMIGSPSVGTLAARIGPRIPMTIGPIVAGVGLAMMALIVPGSSFVGTVLPAVVVFSIGLTITVTPLTSAMLDAAPPAFVGAASGVNNAISRIGGLLAVAALPAVAGITAAPGEPLGSGFAVAMIISAGLCAAGGVISGFTIDGKPRDAPQTRSAAQPA